MKNRIISTTLRRSCICVDNLINSLCKELPTEKLVKIRRELWEESLNFACSVKEGREIKKYIFILSLTDNERIKKAQLNTIPGFKRNKDSVSRKFVYIIS